MTRPIGKQRAQWLADFILPHEAALRSWLGGKLRASMEVDDIVQETYAALASMNDVGHVRDPRAYLFTVARSVVLQNLRRARIVSIEAVAEIDRLPMGSDELSPERHAHAHQELRLLGQVLSKLPAKCRQAFALRKVQGLSQREVAQRMGISENTVEKHIGKGLRILMHAFGRDTEGVASSPSRNRPDAMSRDSHAKTTP